MNVAGSSESTVAGVRSVRPSRSASSKAARKTNGLNVDPGWRFAVVARLYCDRWYDRPPTMARMSPVRGSTATSAACSGPRSLPRLANRASISATPFATTSCATRCRCRSSVVWTATRLADARIATCSTTSCVT